MILELLSPALQNRIGAIAIMFVLSIVWGLLVLVVWQIIRIALEGEDNED